MRKRLNRLKKIKGEELIKEKKEKYGIFLGIHDFLWFNLVNNFI